MTNGGFTLTSTAFREGGAIPRRHTCDGDDVSPDLEWSDAPAEAEAFVLIADDPDAAGFVHWIVYDIAGAATAGLAEGVSESVDAPPQGTNDFGRLGYGGPCPPSGTHRYVFTLYALSEPLALGGAPGGDTVRQEMQGRVIAEARLTGTYTRG